MLNFVAGNLSDCVTGRRFKHRTESDDLHLAAIYLFILLRKSFQSRPAHVA